MDLKRPELDKPPVQNVQYEVVVISGPKLQPEMDLKMGRPNLEPYPRHVVIIGLTYQQTQNTNDVGQVSRLRLWV